MHPCEHYTRFTLLRDAGFFAVAAVTLMIGFSFEPALALDIGASVALLFAVVQVFRASRLTEERFRRCEVWQALEPDERPAGPHGIRFALTAAQDEMLRFAKSAAGTAASLYGSGLSVSLTFGFSGL